VKCRHRVVTLCVRAGRLATLFLYVQKRLLYLDTICTVDTQDSIMTQCDFKWFLGSLKYMSFFLKTETEQCCETVCCCSSSTAILCLGFVFSGMNDISVHPARGKSAIRARTGHHASQPVS
jgi:hypothetical protein